MSAISLVTPPAVEPVDLATMKNWLRVDTTADDAEITAMITDARDWCEQRTGRRFINQTWQWTFDLRWRKGSILVPSDPDMEVPERYADKMIRTGLWIRHQPHLLFPLRPISALTSFTYRLNGTDQEYDMTHVRIETEGAIIFDPFALPPLSDEQYGAFTIQATVGYGTAATSVPPRFLRAIKLLCEHWYENRGLYIRPDGPGRLLPGEMVAGVTDLLQRDRTLSI